MSSGALLKKAKGAQEAKFTLLVIETYFFVGRLTAQCDKGKQQKKNIIFESFRFLCVRGPF